MDTLSIAVLLLIAFLAFQQEIIWLFAGIMVLTAIITKSWGVRIVIILGTIALVLFEFLSQYWFVLFALIAGLVILINERSSNKEGGNEAYSPELMQMLGGGGY